MRYDLYIRRYTPKGLILQTPVTVLAMVRLRTKTITRTIFLGFELANMASSGLMVAQTLLSSPHPKQSHLTHGLRKASQNVRPDVETCGLSRIRLSEFAYIPPKLILEGPCIIFAVYIHSNEIHNVAALIVY